MAQLGVVACVSTRSLVTVSDWTPVESHPSSRSGNWSGSRTRGREGGLPWEVPAGGSAFCVAEGETGWMHLFLPGGTFSFLFPQILEGCFCRGRWWPRPRIVRQEHVCGPGDVKYVQDPSLVGRKGGWRWDQTPRCQRRSGHFPSLFNRLCFQLGQIEDCFIC